MLYLDELIHHENGVGSATAPVHFDPTWEHDDVVCLRHTHEKSTNWSSVEDGLWDRLFLSQSPGIS